MATICPDCGSKNIDKQDASGQLVCTDCGTLLEENALCSALEFVEGAGGASSMVGQFVSNTSSKAYTAGRNVYAISRDSRETTLARGRQKIQDVASRLRLGNHFIDAAHRYFTIAVEKAFVQGRQTLHVVASCLYIACRQEKSQHMLIDFSDALQVNVYTLGTCFLKFRRLLGLKIPILDPALYVYRFAAHLDLDDKANAVALTALRLVGRMKRDWIVVGRRPAGICAAALLIAARAHGFSRHYQDVTHILKVCGLTVNTRVKEFELTPSAGLTLDQFNKVELSTEADPPVYTRNKMREARAKAIQENNVQLLESGALDDKLKGKRASKWRQVLPQGKKFQEKQQEFEKLYQSIERDMVKQGQQEKPKETFEFDTDDDDDEDEEGNNKEGAGKEVSEAETDGEQQAQDHAQKELADADDVSTPQNELAASEGDNAGSNNVAKLPGDGEKEDGDGGDEDEDPMLKKPPAKTDEESSTALVPATQPKVQQQLSKVAPEWRQAYPKDKYGNAMMLPNYATPEELEPSTLFVEGKIDTVPWKESMPTDMVEDFDSIFRNPREIAEKEAIFNKINKDYINLQNQKRKHKATQNQKENQSDKDMEEQEKKARKYMTRKRRRTLHGEETTEDALLEAVANRKISRKINYDAMSAIFDDDGTFDVGGGLGNNNNNNNELEGHDGGLAAMI
mmetsp:Transcript_22771/g.56254  ORF Transcript_22771/g.56254 Transcript_22771/m.56254 type:complete len:682 (+) Transcript_22771:134-2179(+)|eukprot:CAMPEP_0113627670 /NCGR_PEP_ID=MMETSP0017_2-20120614/14333_1 /TAXON_ID=2856 /ORGANISM="Cylindrotheca closterium" /LENGTH=681 /DNA_ID=CAMNT_0000537939 /DNA_START=75 /DNA_END=2120 /DNA_ORIENTATION=- /assembly_acc=CAM_ASM_000147